MQNIFIFSSVLLGGVIVTALLLQHMSPPVPYRIETPLNALEIREQFSAAVNARGAGEAYREIVDAFRMSDFNLQHNVAHVIGETLYETNGIAGIQYCDTSFAFGCYHGFFTRAVSGEGLGAMRLLDDACANADAVSASACRHGIGHGILEYLGHERLVEALNVCLETTQEEPLVGCTSGVFMEYNVPLRYSDDGVFATIPREHVSENPYEPCDSVPNSFTLSCYYELPQWWVQIFDHDYGYLGSLCETLDDDSSEVCFLGIGKVLAPSMEFNPEKTRDGCARMPDERGKYLCASAAAWSIAQDGGGVEASKVVCTSSRVGYRRSCPADSFSSHE